SAENAARELHNQARGWEQLDTDHQTVRALLVAAQDRAAPAATLEPAVGRLTTLRLAVPALARVANLRQQLSTATAECDRLTGDREALLARQKAATDAAGTERQKIAVGRARQGEIDQLATSINHRCERYREQISQAEQAALLHSRLAELREELQGFE